MPLGPTSCVAKNDWSLRALKKKKKKKKKKKTALQKYMGVHVWREVASFEVSQIVSLEKFVVDRNVNENIQLHFEYQQSCNLLAI